MAQSSCKCNHHEIERSEGTRLMLGAWIEEHHVQFEEKAPKVFNGYFLPHSTTILSRRGTRPCEPDLCGSGSIGIARRCRNLNG